jgi:hypothetical protein
MDRQPFTERKILLRTETQRDALMSIAMNLPLDSSNPLEIVVREVVKPRKRLQNDLMWAGPLADIAEQAYVSGRAFTADIWHEHFKLLFLPEGFDAALCREGYRKWDITPAGQRVLVGSTTQLTVKGMAQYITQIEAFGADLGVEFHSVAA